MTHRPPTPKTNARPARAPGALLAAAIAGCCALLMDGCGLHGAPQAAIVVTIHPLQSILAELVPAGYGVQALLQPGTSPHTYEPRPSDARAAEAARGLFYIAPDIDGWAANMPAARAVATSEWIPDHLALHWEEQEKGHDHAHGGVNTHYWGDPLLVEEMLPQFEQTLLRMFPGEESQVRDRVQQFRQSLQQLDKELSNLLAPLRGKRVVLFHPSWNYFLRRYGIEVAGVVEPTGGKEMSPKYLKNLIDALKRQQVDAIFTEPQLSRRAAEVVAESGPWPLAELDPMGGLPGRESYRDLLLYNAKVLREALQ